MPQSDPYPHYIEFRHVYKTFDRPVLVDSNFYVDAGETVRQRIGPVQAPVSGRHDNPRELARIVAHRPRPKISLVPDAGQLGARLAGSVDSGPAAGPVAQFLVTPPHRTTGVIEVINKQDGSLFLKEDLELLSAFAAQAAVAVENARLFTLTDQALAARVEELSVMQRIDRELNAHKFILPGLGDFGDRLYGTL